MGGRGAAVHPGQGAGVADEGAVALARLVGVGGDQHQSGRLLLQQVGGQAGCLALLDQDAVDDGIVQKDDLALHVVAGSGR